MKSAGVVNRFLFLSVILCVGVCGGLPATAADKIKVVSVNYPLHYFAERIATDAFEVSYLVPSDVDPAFWKPDNESMIAFQQADIILRNGADYAKWMKTVTLPSSTMVNTSREFSDRYMKTEGKEHRHGNGHVHSHAGTAFTTWMDFSQAAVQAGAIANRLSKQYPAEAEGILANLKSLEKDLSALDSEMKALGEKAKGKTFIASHPIYHYWSRAYGVSMEALEWEPEMKLDPAALDDLKKAVAKNSATWLIWEGPPSNENVEAVAKQGLKSIVISPSANRPESGDWLEVMKENLAQFAKVLEP